jgi:hypothetical protein
MPFISVNRLFKTININKNYTNKNTSKYKHTKEQNKKELKINLTYQPWVFFFFPAIDSKHAILFLAKA